MPYYAKFSTYLLEVLPSFIETEWMRVYNYKFFPIKIIYIFQQGEVLFRNFVNPKPDGQKNKHPFWLLWHSAKAEAHQT